MKHLKRSLTLLAVLLLVLALTACSANLSEDRANTYSGAMTAQKSDEAYSFSITETALERETPELSTDRKLITTVQITAETENLAQLLSWLEQQTASLGGYIERLESDTPASADGCSANLTIRVPAQQLEAFTQQIDTHTNVLWRSLEQRDITTTYVDTQAQRDALTVEQSRLLELLEQAGDLSEVLQIESRLTEVRYELESLESTLRSYDNQVDYATVRLSVQEVVVFTAVEEPGFWQKIGDGFVSSARGVWNAVKTVFSGVVIALPWLLVLLLPPLLFLLIFFGVRRRRKRRT